MRYVLDIDISEFPKDLTLTHGKEGDREWWEWWERGKGIVIQRYAPRPYYIYFITGETIRVLKVDEYVTAAFTDIHSAVKALEELGFNVVAW